MLIRLSITKSSGSFPNVGIFCIFQLLLQQFDVLDSMTAQEFLEFREVLFPASGFQSHQFRHIEIKLGLRTVRHAIKY